MVLLMSVFAGFGGQKFIPETISKIRYIREEIDRRGLQTLIEIDGGVNTENAAALFAAILFSVSFLVGADNLCCFCRGFLTNSTVCCGILTCRVIYPAFNHPKANDCDSEFDHCAGYVYAESDNLNPIIFSISEKVIFTSSMPHFSKYAVNAINLSPFGILCPPIKIYTDLTQSSFKSKA